MTPRMLGILLIPAIGLSLTITAAPLVDHHHVIPDSGAGWLEGTAWIYDARWRVVLGAHTPGDFERLDELEPGDRIVIVGQRGRVLYEVTDMQWAWASDTSWLMPTRAHTLTLITCTGVEDVRLIINARRLGASEITPPARVSLGPARTRGY